jgi:hypothetical protein
VSATAIRLCWRIWRTVAVDAHDPRVRRPRRNGQPRPAHRVPGLNEARPAVTDPSSNPAANRFDGEYARQGVVNEVGQLIKQSAVTLRKAAGSNLTAPQQLWRQPPGQIGPDNDGYPLPCLQVSGRCTQHRLGRTVNLIQGAARVVTQSAEAIVAAAGAVGGAAVNGVIGGVQGAVTGIKNGVSSGSHSTPAAALAIAAIGATGLVEWPILLGVGGTAIVVRQLKQRSEGQEKPTLAAVPNAPRRTPAAKRTSGRKATKSTASSARKSASRNRRAAAHR